jgi:hypothetical protein
MIKTTKNWAFKEEHSSIESVLKLGAKILFSHSTMEAKKRYGAMILISFVHLLFLYKYMLCRGIITPSEIANIPQ